MTGKERALLRRAANGLETIFQVGKDGVDDALCAGVGGALAARELIKLRTLDACPLGPAEAAREIADRLGCEVIQVIGSRFVLYRRNPEVDRYGI